MAQVSASKTKRIIVLGGGISGLSFVHYLRTFASAYQKDHLLGKIILVEAQDYLGGSIKSKVFDDGVVHEMGPRSIRTSGTRSHSTMTLAEHLGLDHDVHVVSTNSAAGKNRQIYTKQRSLEMMPTPSGLGFFKSLPGTKSSIAKVAYRDIFKAPKTDLSKYEYQDPPLYDFVSNRFGEEVADNILDPIMRGITGGDCRKLSTRALVGEFLDKEQAYGSVIKGLFKPPVKTIPHDDLFATDVLNSMFKKRLEIEKALSYTFHGGLQQLPERIANSLLNNNPDNKVSIYNQTVAHSLSFNTEFSPVSAIVKSIDGDRIKIDADYVVSAIPSTDFGKLLHEALPSSNRTIWDDITDVPHNPIGCVCVEFKNDQLRKLERLQSFGFLTHSKSESSCLGISFDSMSFPDKDPSVFKMTVMIGREGMESETQRQLDMTKVTNGQLEDLAMKEIRRILEISDEPTRMTTHMWTTGIAQYRPGHKERVERTRSEIMQLGIPLRLIGQSYDGVAINDVIFSARMNAHDFIKSL